MSTPFGPKVQPQPLPAPPEWTPVPGAEHLEQNHAGQWRTRDHQPIPVPGKRGWAP